MQLSGRQRDLAGITVSRDLRFIEAIAATSGFARDVAKVGSDGRARVRLFAKALQLRVMRVAAREAGEDGLRQQRLAPERDEAFGVEVLGMEGPEAQGSGS